MADLNNLFGDLQGKGHIHVNYSVSSGQGASAEVPASRNSHGPVKKCVGCNTSFPRVNFFNKQWKGADNKPDRRCKDCHREYHKSLSKQKRDAQKLSHKMRGSTNQERALAERQRLAYERQHLAYERQRLAYERQWQQQRQRFEQRQRMLEDMSRSHDEAQRRKVERVREAERRAQADKRARQARQLQHHALANQARPVEHAPRKRMRDSQQANRPCNFATTRAERNLETEKEEVNWRKTHKKPPHHPSNRLSCSDIEPYFTFAVTSGAIRFGPSDMLENTLTGGLTSSSANTAASCNDIALPFVVSDSTEQRKWNGSPKLLQTCTYRAYNGNWYVYKLEKRVSPEVGPELNSKTGELCASNEFVRAGTRAPARPAGARERLEVVDLQRGRPEPHSSTMADLNNLFSDLQGKSHIHVNYSVGNGRGDRAEVPAALKQFERVEPEISAKTKKAAKRQAKKGKSKKSKKSKSQKSKNKPKADGNAKLKKCSKCAEFKPRAGFSNKQWKGETHKAGRRCKCCTGSASHINQQVRSGTGKRKQALGKQTKAKQCHQSLAPAVALNPQLEEPRRPQGLYPRPPPGKDRSKWTMDQRIKDEMRRFEESLALRQNWLTEEEWRNAHRNMPPLHLDDDFTNRWIVAQRKFEVRSGAICVGRPYNCRHGATQEPANFQSDESSTSFNHRANNGTWLVYKLENQAQPAFPSNFNRRTGECVRQAWFICLDTLCPVQEARLLLYHGLRTEYAADKSYAWNALSFDSSPPDSTGVDFAIPSSSQPEDGFYVLDAKDAKDEMWAQGSRSICTDGMESDQRQRCLIGYNKGGAKSILFYDTNCNFEEQYFQNGQYSINHMPWTPDYFVCRSWEPNENFYETEMVNLHGQVETTYYRKIMNVRGEVFAVLRHGGAQRADDFAEATGPKMQKRVTDFFRNNSGTRADNYQGMGDDGGNDDYDSDDTDLGAYDVDINEYVFESYEYEIIQGYRKDRILSREYEGYTLEDLEEEVHFQKKNGYEKLLPVKECLERGGVEIEDGLWSGKWNKCPRSKDTPLKNRIRLNKNIIKAILGQ